MRIQLILFVLAILGAPAYANECDNAQTQSAMNACSIVELAAVDSQLNDAYLEFRKRLSGNASARSSLIKAQRAWIEFRDAECKLEGAAVEGGSAQAMIVNQCKTRITSARLTDFRTRLSCGEGDLTCFNVSDGLD